MKTLKKIMGFIGSYELMFVLLIIIALSMSIGTVLPQQDEPENYIRFWGKLESAADNTDSMMGAAPPLDIDRAKGERIFNFFNSLGFLNIYHSTWFLILSFLLCLNVGICALRRVAKCKMFMTGITKIPLRYWEVKRFPIPIEWTDSCNMKLVEAYLLVSERLRRAGFNLKSGKSGIESANPSTNGKTGPTMQTFTMVAQRGFPSKTLSVLFHISMILALLACGLGSLYAFETKITIEKNLPTSDWLNRGEFAYQTLNGELVGLAPSLSMSKPTKLDLPHNMADRIKPMLSVSGNENISEMLLKKIQSADENLISTVVEAHKAMLGNPYTIDHFDRLIRYPKFYGVVLDDFHAEYLMYKQKPFPKDWYPKVSFLDSNGKPLYTKVAESNHPAKYKGIQYYISDYTYKFQLIVESPDGTTHTLPSTSSDEKGFPGFMSRHAYEFQPQSFDVPELGINLTVKNIISGKLIKSHNATDSEQIEPYVEVKYSPLDESATEVMPSGSQPEKMMVTDNITQTSNQDAPVTEPSMNDGGKPIKMPDYLKLRTETGYIQSSEEPLTINGYKVYLGEINPLVVFGVRHDPYIPWFYFFGYLACLAMAFKIYAPAYRVRITIRTIDDDHVQMEYHLFGWGLFSNVNSVRKNLIIPKDIN